MKQVGLIGRTVKLRDRTSLSVKFFTCYVVKAAQLYFLALLFPALEIAKRISEALQNCPREMPVDSVASESARCAFFCNRAGELPSGSGRGMAMILLTYPMLGMVSSYIAQQIARFIGCCACISKDDLAADIPSWRNSVVLIVTVRKSLLRSRAECSKQHSNENVL